MTHDLNISAIPSSTVWYAHLVVQVGSGPLGPSVMQQLPALGEHRLHLVHVHACSINRCRTILHSLWTDMNAAHGSQGDRCCARSPAIRHGTHLMQPEGHVKWNCASEGCRHNLLPSRILQALPSSYAWSSIHQHPKKPSQHGMEGR